MPAAARRPGAPRRRPRLARRRLGLFTHCMCTIYYRSISILIAILILILCYAILFYVCLISCPCMCILLHTKHIAV